MVYKKKPLNKRWSASANGSFMGVKAGFNLQSRSKRSLTAAVERIVRKDLETPQHFIQNDTNQVSATHNTIYTFNPLSGITQGTTYGNRIGDEIHVDSIKINGIINYLGTASNAGTVHCRLSLVKSTKQIIANTWSSGLGLSTMYIGNTGVTITPSGIFDPKLVTKVMDTYFTLTPPAVSSQGLSRHFEETIKLDTKFLYSTGQQFGKSMNYYFVFSTWIYGGATGTTTTAQIVMNSDVIFKNSK